jgi:hypothetical protein
MYTVLYILKDYFLLGYPYGTSDIVAVTYILSQGEDWVGKERPSGLHDRVEE